MELGDLLGNAQAPTAVAPKVKRLNGWQKYRAATKLTALSAGSCLFVQVGRLVPGLMPVVGIALGAGCLGLLAWAMLTEGDQRLEISLVVIASVGGVALGIRDAAELLALVGAQAWIAIALIAAIMAAVFIMEGRSHAK